MEWTRKGKKARFNIITDNLGGAWYPHCLMEAGTRSGCLQSVVQREAFLCREFYIKETETKVPKKEKEKRKTTCIRLSAAYSIFFFFFFNKWCQQMFLHSHQLLVLKSYSSKVFVQINPIVMPGRFCGLPTLSTFSCRTHWETVWTCLCSCSRDVRGPCTSCYHGAGSALAAGHMAGFPSCPSASA